MDNLSIGAAFRGVVSKLSEHNTRIHAAQTAADAANATAADSVQAIQYPDGTPLPKQNGVITLPATVLAGLTVDPTTGLATVTPGQGGSGSATVTAAIAGPNIVQPL